MPHPPGRGHSPLSPTLMQLILFPILPVVLAGLILAGSSARSQTLLFDFGGANTTLLGASPDDPDRTWNNITGAIGTAVPGTPVAQLNGAMTSAGVATGINLVMLSRFNGVNENGTQASTIYPIDATRDSLFGNTEVFNNLSDIFPSFKLTGLDPGFNHNITFYASRTGVGDKRGTLYTVTNGTTSVEVTLNAANNIESTVSAELIKPSATGELTVSLAPSPENTNGNHFTYMGVMKVDLGPAVQQPIIFSDEPDDVTVAAGRPVTFTAAVNSTPPYIVQWKKDNVDIPDANQFTYSIPSAGAGLNNTRYSVRVSNLAFNATSRQALLRVNSDAVAPTITSASSIGPFHIAVVFSEDLEEVTAEDPAHYVLDGGNIFVATAELQTDRKTVVLTPGLALLGTVPVQISGINDLAGNRIQANSAVSVNILQPDGKFFLIDFGGGDTTQQGGGNNDPLNVWNNANGGIITTDGGSLPNLVRNNGDSTGVSLTVVSRFNNVNTQGTLLTTAPFPPNATRDTAYGNTAIFNDLTDIHPVIRLGGLNPAEGHDLLFYGSRMEAGENRETRYTVTGATETVVDYNVANNLLNTAVVTGMRPNQSGEITIALTPGPNNVHPNLFTYLGVLKVTPRTSTGPLEILKPVIMDGRIILNWIGTGALESSTSLTMGTWNPILPAPVPPYSENIVPGQRKFFRLRP